MVHAKGEKHEADNTLTHVFNGMQIFGCEAERRLEVVVHFVDVFIHEFVVQRPVLEVVPGVLEHRAQNHLPRQHVPATNQPDCVC